MRCIYCGDEFELKSTVGRASERKNCYKEECEKRRKKENHDRFKAKNKMDNNIDIKEQPIIKPNGIDIIQNDTHNEIDTRKIYELEVTINEIDYKDVLDISCILDQSIVRLKELKAETQKKEAYYNNRQQDLLHKLETFNFKSVADKISFVNDLKTTRQYRRVCKNRHSLIDQILNELSNIPNNKQKVEQKINEYKNPIYRGRANN